MLRRIELLNWQCFRGTHGIDLEPKAYALTARYETDPGRSNWGGKSAVLEAIDFAVTGRLYKPRRFDADGWITKGEKQGAVQVTLEDGTTIRRERTRGRRTDVSMTSVGGRLLTQEDAERELLKHLAFDEDDFKTVAYFEQGAMSRLIRTEPEKRFDIIRGWLGLAAGERAEETATEIVKKRIRVVQQLKTRREAIVTMLGTDEGESQVDTLAHVRDDTERDIEQLIEQQNTHRELDRCHRLIEAYNTVVEQGKVAAGEVAALDLDDDIDERLSSHERHLAQQAANHAAAQRDVESKKKVKLGLFDGRCPVADIECPATKQINDDRNGATNAFVKAKQNEVRAAKVFDDARYATGLLRTQSQEAFRAKTKLEALRERATKLLPEVNIARKVIKQFKKEKTDEEIDQALTTLRAQYNRLIEAIAEDNARNQQRQKLTKELHDIEKELTEESAQAAVATQTRTIFRAAQRRVAERALTYIGDAANDMLKGAEVNLSIEIQWEHEGKGYAKACEMCGASFPTSQKVKRCATCDAERGQNIVQRLEFVLSDRSGAADDFSGIGLQLAAGSYLLRMRQSPWAMAMIDEPFSQMDRTVRRAAARQLLNLLGTSAFRQVMVISHSAETTEMFPNQINIVIAKDGERRIETTGDEHEKASGIRRNRSEANAQRRAARAG